ncbi:MAG TPA: response regulator [Bryobacteraceae bacterium]|nr:response regulator [Bryobacteraceae bacterium]
MLKDQVEILLVEDDPDDLDLAISALNDAHVCNRIVTARDGEEALDFVFCRGAHSERDPARHPRLILLDLKLPKVDGLEVIEQIRRNPRTKAIPVVILTSSKQEEDVVRGYHLGVNSYIQKPVDFDQFQAAIKHLGYYWLLLNQPPPAAAFTGDAPHDIAHKGDRE